MTSRSSLFDKLRDALLSLGQSEKTAKGLMRNNRFSRCRALARTGMAWGCGREPAPGLERVSIRGPSVA